MFQGSCDLSWVIHIDGRILYNAEYSERPLPNIVSEFIKQPEK